MPDLLITSAANPRLKAILALRRRRVREAENRTLVEGFEEIGLALAAGVRAQTLLICPELMHPEVEADSVIEQVRERGGEVVRLSRLAFTKVAYREGPEGFLAVVPGVGTDLDSLVLGPNPLVVIAEGVEKPGNLGAILRTADAVGVDAVIAADPVTDWGNPNVVRASKGTVFAVAVASASGVAVMEWLAERQISVLAATPEADLEHTDSPMSGPLAIAVGAEKYGLSAQTLARAEHRVRIPMRGRVNSLNVATSAAVLLYEAVRQRG